MNAVLLLILSFLVSLIFSGTSLARDCWTDIDCPSGATCIRPDYEGESKGVCSDSSEGSKPSLPSFRIKNDTEIKRPERNTKGKTCFSDPDCDPGQTCIMKSGQMYGICR